MRITRTTICMVWKDPVQISMHIWSAMNKGWEMNKCQLKEYFVTGILIPISIEYSIFNLKWLVDKDNYRCTCM